MPKKTQEIFIKNTPTYLINLEVPAFVGLSHKIFLI